MILAKTEILVLFGGKAFNKLKFYIYGKEIGLGLVVVLHKNEDCDTLSFVIIISLLHTTSTILC